uniref:Uncharacterized protein n=1 Tax=Anopheles melas TaxID=34690 RepID=A0A182TZY1_9DIPT
MLHSACRACTAGAERAPADADPSRAADARAGRVHPAPERPKVRMVVVRVGHRMVMMVMVVVMVRMRHVVRMGMVRPVRMGMVVVVAVAAAYCGRRRCCRCRRRCRRCRCRRTGAGRSTNATTGGAGTTNTTTDSSSSSSSSGRRRCCCCRCCAGCAAGAVPCRRRCRCRRCRCCRCRAGRRRVSERVQKVKVSFVNLGGRGLASGTPLAKVVGGGNGVTILIRAGGTGRAAG